MISTILNNRYIQIVIALLIGCAIGAIFYPSKTIKEEIEQKYERQLQQKEEEHIKAFYELSTKHTEEINILKSKTEETTSKIHSLTQENYELRQKSEESTLRIVKPDGTIVEKTYKKSETEQISQITTEIKSEFSRKVKEIEQKWTTIHKERVSRIKIEHDKVIAIKETEIAQLKKKTTIEINKRNFGIYGGYMTNKNYYSGVQYDVFGPVFLDAHVQSDFQDNAAGGIGFGFRF